jgi:hypothetical protein
VTFDGGCAASASESCHVPGQLAIVFYEALKIPTITAHNESFWRVALDSRHGWEVFQIILRRDPRQRHNKTVKNSSSPHCSRTYIIIQPVEERIAIFFVVRLVRLVSPQLQTSSNGNDKKEVVCGVDSVIPPI